MLEVVEDEQRPLVGVVRLREAERLQCDRQHEARVGERRERDEVDAVGELVQQLGCDLQGQPRLAGAAGARDRHQPGAPEQVLHLQLLDDAADERMRRLRQVRPVQAPERGERAETELVDALRPGEVLQPVLAEIDDLLLVREQVARRIRQEHLPSVPGGRDPGCAMDVHPHVAVLVSSGSPVWMPIRTRTAGRGATARPGRRPPRRRPG